MNSGSHRRITRYRLLITIVLCLTGALSIAAQAVPRIGLNATRGPVGTEVTITGAAFGATQGSSTVTFNGSIGIPKSWSDTKIVVPVPEAATTGPVVVTVKGIASNSVLFTVSGV